MWCKASVTLGDVATISGVSVDQNLRYYNFAVETILELIQYNAMFI